MSSRQERRQKEREELRKARKQQEAKQATGERKRLILGYGLAGILVAAVAAGLIVVLLNSGGGADEGDAHVSVQSGSTNGVALDGREGTAPPPITETDLKVAAKDAKCELRESLPNEGATHLPRDADTPNYKTNPPTSGNHVEPPYQQADGAYSEKPGDIFAVHSLEHGRILIQYDPDLPEADQLALRGLYDTLYAGALIFPNPDMPYAVAATAWRNLIGCETFEGEATLDAIRDFGIAKFGQGPEPVNGFGPLDGPTPGRPDLPSSS